MIRKLLVWSIAAVIPAAFLWAAPQSSAPQDAGQIILNRACTVCHNVGEITKFKGYYDRSQWADVVRTMRADGAQLADGEVPQLVDYLVRTYGRVELPEGDGRKILETSCAGCHDLATATKSRRTRMEWQELLGRMIVLGAKLDESQRPALMDYLVQNFAAPER